MLANMAISLIEHKRIKTTLAKAKALRVYIEPLITKSKKDTMHSRRVVFSYLQNKEAVKELFGEISARVAERPGGYTRILKLGNRLGDNAEMALIELVDFNEFDYTQNKEKGSSKKRRGRRRGGKKKATDQNEAVAAVEEEVTDVVEVVEDQVEAVAEEVVEEVEATTEEVVETTEEVVAEATEEAPAEPESPATDEEEKKED